jgi:hypothetical protein
MSTSIVLSVLDDLLDVVIAETGPI